MKTLYRYNNHTLEKHVLTEDCMPQKEPFNRFGQLYRCRNSKHDFYGYFKRKEAKAEEIEVLKADIISLNMRLKDLTRSKE